MLKFKEYFTESFVEAEKHKKVAEKARNDGNMNGYHSHMANYHENLGNWHERKGRSNVADIHFQRAREHHENSLNFPYTPETYSLNKVMEERKTQKNKKSKCSLDKDPDYDEDENDDSLNNGEESDSVSENLEKVCWDGYKAIGLKKKGKKAVPNCVPE